MNFAPNPTELPQPVVLETVARRRSLFCTEYDACLDAAAERGWTSWTCERCPMHALRREMAARFAAEHHYRPAHSAEGALAL